MAADLIAGRIRLAVNSMDLTTPWDFLGAQNDTVGRLQMGLMGFGTAADGPFMGVAHARGTVAAPANSADLDNMGDFEWYAYAGGWKQSAEIRAFVTGAVVNGVTPSSNITFRVASAGAMTTRAIIFSTGQLALGSASRATETDAAAQGLGTLWVAENGKRSAIAYQYSGENALPTQLFGRKNRGDSLSVPTNVTNGDGVCEWISQSYSGGWFDGSFIRVSVDAAVVNTQGPATRIGFYTNVNNATGTELLRLTSDRKIIGGDSITAYSDSTWNFVCPAGADAMMATFGQNAGGGQNFLINFATYQTFSNGSPARINVVDNNFSCSFRFEHKKTGANANTMVPSLLLLATANSANAAFFSTNGSFGNGQGVIFLGNANTIPNANPVAGAILYVDPADGKTKIRGSAGTVTIIANA